MRGQAGLPAGIHNGNPCGDPVTTYEANVYPGSEAPRDSRTPVSSLEGLWRLAGTNASRSDRHDAQCMQLDSVHRDRPATTCPEGMSPCPGTTVTCPDGMFEEGYKVEASHRRDFGSPNMAESVSPAREPCAIVGETHCSQDDLIKAEACKD